MSEQKKVTAAELTPEFIEAQAAEFNDLVQKAKTAADTYLADLDQRKAALAEQASGYQTELAKLNAARKALAGKINDLSSRGMIDEAAEADVELEALDKAISTLERKLKIVSTAELKGDPKLYQAAKDAHAEMVAGQPIYREKIQKLISVANEEIARLEEIAKDLGYMRDRNHGHYATNVFTRVDRHFRELDRIEREVKERRAAAAQAERERKTDCFVFA